MIVEAAIVIGAALKGDEETSTLFRVDTGNKAGLGHLCRCLSLAFSLCEGGIECVFLVTDKEARRRTGKLGFATVDVGEGVKDDLSGVIKTAHNYGCNAVVVDSYGITAGYLTQVRDAGLFLVVINDIPLFPFTSHIVINGSAYAQQLAYVSSSGDTTFLLGPKYALMRPEFRHLKVRKVNDVVQNILLTLGAGDPNDLMPRLLTSLDGIPGEFVLMPIIGPFFENRNKIRSIAANCRHHVRVLEDPSLIRDLMSEADLAISGGGQTLYELAATGTPTISVQVAENQARNISALAAAGFLYMAGNVGQADLLDRVRNAAQELMTEAHRRKKMSEAGQSMYDGLGATRVAEILTAKLHSGRFGIRS